ncbi:hypothetical protein MASR2M54_19560 [Aliarcobacter cryaerophilus]
MFEILQYDFIQNALLAGILISIAAGIIGTLVCGIELLSNMVE